MSTLRTGNSSFPSLETVMLCPSGIASHRSFSAPSDQNGAFTRYGTSPGAGAAGFVALTQPVALNVSGTSTSAVPPNTMR